MKKILYSVMALAIAAMTFTACEDVPEPYPTPNGGGGGGNTGSLPYASANLNTGWTLQEVTVGAQPWSKGNSYAQATGYQAWDGGSTKSNKAVEGWLVSPAISTVGYENVKLSFNQTIRYTNNVTGWEANHKVYVATSFNGTDASTSWKELDFKPKASPYSDWTLYSSGEIQLPAEFVGKETVYIGFWFKAPANASTTWELQSFKKEEGIAQNNDEPDEPTPTEDLGTAEAPLTVAKALEIINGYEAAGESKTDAYVKGKIVSVDNYNSTYKSITYYISDDGTSAKQLQVYSGKGINGADFSSKSDLNPGATVVVKGKLKKFVKNETVTPEINQSSSIISIEGNEGGDTPTPQPGGNTIEAGKYFFVYTNAGSVQVGTPVEAGKDFGYMYLADAKVTDNTLENDADNLFTFTTTEGGFTIQDASGRYYYMDDTHNSFQVSASKPASNYVWTVSVADDGKATVTNAGTGKVIQYVAKYKEFTPTASGDGLPMLLKPGAKVEDAGEQGQGGQGGGGEVSGNSISVAASSFGLENQAKLSTLTLNDGTTLTFDGGGNTNTPAFYTAGNGTIRIYPKNSFTINAGSKKIIAIEIVCNEYNGTLYNASGNITVEGNKMTIDGTKLKATGINNSTITVKNISEGSGAATQLRLENLIINYAE